MAVDPFSPEGIEARIGEVIPSKVAIPPTFTYPSMPQTPGASYGNGAIAPVEPRSNAAPVASGPKAKGIEEYKRAFLDGIAGPESGGVYNIRFHPTKKTYFDNYADHPNIAEMGPDGPSTASGRYQITGTTWKELKDRGLIPKNADFSPENQDKAALALAEMRYKAYTGGRNLWEDVQAQGLSPSIMKTLGPTWSGFKDNPDKAAQWFEASLGGKPMQRPDGVVSPAGAGTGGKAPSDSFHPDAVAENIAKMFPQQAQATPPVVAPAAMLPTPKVTQTQGAAPQGYTPQPAEWGPASQFANGLMLNKGPQVNALTEGARYMASAVGSGQPLGEAYAKAKNEIYPQALQDWQQAQQGYADEHPLAAPLLQGAGNLAPLLAGTGLASKGLELAGRAAPSLVPALNFVGGVANPSASIAQKIGSGAVSGAWQGAMGNAMLGQDIAPGAGVGAAVGAVTNPLLATALAPLTATARSEVARVAQDALNEGVNVPAGAIIKQAGTQKVVQAISGKGGEDVAETFTKQVAKLFGADKEMKQLGVKGLTPEVIDATKARLGQGFEDFASKAKMDINGQTFMDLMDVSQKAHAVSPNIGKQVDGYISELIAHSQNNGQLTGKQFRYLTNSNSMLQDLYSNPNTVEFAKGLTDVMMHGLERALPGAASEIRDLSKQYRAFMVVKPLAEGNSTNGLLGPNVANVLSKAGYDLAGQVARLVPKLTQSGAEVAESGLGKLLKSQVGMGGMIAGGITSMQHLPDALRVGAEHPLAALAAGLGAAGAYGAKKGVGHYLGSPDYTQRVINNTLAPKAGAWFNPFVPLGAGAFPSGIPNPLEAR